MASFYNAETSEPVNVMYISSSRKGNVVLKAPELPSLRMRGPGPRGPEVVVANSGGKAKAVLVEYPKSGEYRWAFTGLDDGMEIVALDGKLNILAKIPVRRLDLDEKLKSYKSITQRFNKRGMKIDLDSHIDYVCYASQNVGEGIYFRPKNAENLTNALTETGHFHHDDRSDPFGALAAFATIGEGYREVSTPSLHVAISDTLSSVHIDSYAFLIYDPNGNVVITLDVGEHIGDELLLRYPMPWLRRNGHTFIASVLQRLHLVLPNSTNQYSPIVGLGLEAGGSPNRDLRSGVPRLTLESTYNWWGHGTHRRWRHRADLRLWTYGNPERNPSWTLSLKAEAACEDVRCRDNEKSIGFYLTAGEF